MVAGCGGGSTDNTVPQAPKKLQVTLPWTDGSRIPASYTCDGVQRKPAVHVAGADGHPVAIVMTDPDAPGGTFVHWTRWGSVEGENSFGKQGYAGPCPPKGDQPHHYVTTAYALRSELKLPAGAKPDKVLAAIQEDALTSGSSTGLYSR